jgi:hypothetical protein
MKLVFIAAIAAAVVLYLLAALRHAGTTLGEIYSDAGNALLLLDIAVMQLVVMSRRAARPGGARDS